MSLAVGNSGREVERRIVNGTVVQSHLPPLRNLGNFVHPTFACVFSEETLKAGGPFYLVSMPGEVQSRLAITRLAITRFGYNAVGRGPRISAARGKMGATANNNAVINCHLCLWNPHVCLVQVYLETI